MVQKVLSEVKRVQRLHDKVHGLVRPKREHDSDATSEDGNAGCMMKRAKNTV